jgi:hypothetical protein
MMFQWSDDYNAETIFDQVWEAPYDWWLDWKPCESWKGPEPHNCLGIVKYDDPNEDDTVHHKHVTVEMIDGAVIPTYEAFMNIPADHPRFRSFADWIEDLDANDVDNILQRAVFGEIVYG